MSSNLPPIEVVPVGAFLGRSYPEPQWIIDDLIPARGLASLAGAPKAGKTMVALAISVAAASGQTVLGRGTRQARTLFMAEEGRGVFLQRRIDKLTANLGVSVDAIPLGVSIRQGVRLDTPDDLARLEWAISEFQPGLVVLDCLVRMHRSVENDSRDMAILMENLEGIAERQSCAILFLHHVAKLSEESSGGYAMRGSGVLASSTEANLVLRRTKTGARIDAQLRDAPDVRIDLAFNADRLEFEAIELGQPVSRGRISEVDLLEKLASHPDSTVDALAGFLATSDTTLRPVVRRLVDQGRVSSGPAPRGKGLVYRAVAA